MYVRPNSIAHREKKNTNHDCIDSNHNVRISSPPATWTGVGMRPRRKSSEALVTYGSMPTDATAVIWHRCQNGLVGHSHTHLALVDEVGHGFASICKCSMRVEDVVPLLCMARVPAKHSSPKIKHTLPEPCT